MSTFFLKLLVAACLLFVMITPVVASEHLNGEVKRIYPTRDTINFRLKDDTCISGSQYYYFRMNDTDNVGKYAARNWYAMLLASAHAGTPVSVSVDDCPTEGHVEINYLYQDY